MTPFKLFISCALGVMVAATATGGATAAQCFLQNNINGFSAPNDRTLYVRVGVRDIWRLDLMTDCTGLSFRNSFGLQGSPTGPWICNPLDATVRFHESGARMTCPVSAMHKLSPEEAAALPKKDRP
jgi:hypothetical protein